MNNTSIQAFFKKPVVTHFLFWGIVFLFHTVTANWPFYSGLRHVIENYLVMTGAQIIVAYVVILVLIPQFLNKKKNLTFVVLLLIVLVSVVTIYHLSKYYYFEPTYPEPFKSYFKTYGYFTVFERVTNIPVTISKSVFFASPTLLLLLYRFYKNQQRLSKINEQKKTAELTALKHQLNPHFLFNTLNNLYVLALKKSDKTPEVIEKLSDILDYMLYRCNDKYVTLQKEIELIDNYLTLEKIRYGKRVNILFDKQIEEDVKVGPLLLLTFIENAFKHGVSQELKEAFITINIVLEEGQIIFNIENSKSDSAFQKGNTECIGIKNVKQQLELLYADDYSLDITDVEDKYHVSLKLVAK